MPSFSKEEDDEEGNVGHFVLLPSHSWKRGFQDRGDGGSHLRAREAEGSDSELWVWERPRGWMVERSTTVFPVFLCIFIFGFKIQEKKNP